MVLTVPPLPALTAQDVMSREVVTIPQRVSLGDAARLLRRASVSAAPVVDEQGRCVGVLSAADFLRWAEDGCPEGRAVMPAPAATRWPVSCSAAGKRACAPWPRAPAPCRRSGRPRTDGAPQSACS